METTGYYIMIKIALALYGLCLAFYLVVIIVPSFFYKQHGNRLYMMLIMIVPVALGISSIMVEGMYRMYYSEIIALNFVLVYLVSTQSG